MAKKYADRWGVPIEEARKKVRSFLAKDPEEAEPEGKGEAPTKENLFPPAIGPLSKKVQDVNQSLLSQAYTRNQLRELNLPPEQLRSLDDRVGLLEKNVSDVLTMTNQTMKELRDAMEAKNQEELLRQMDERIEPLREKLDKMGEAPEGGPAKLPLVPKTPADIIKEADEYIDTSKAWLENRGYKIETPGSLATLSKAVAEESAEELARKLKEKGYEVKAPPTWEDIQNSMRQLKEEAKKELAEEMRLEEKKQEMMLQVGGSIMNALMSAFNKPELEGALQKVKEAVLNVRKAAAPTG
jgi:hypothetical protein